VRVVCRCLEKSPEERFQSVRDLAFAIDALSSPSAAPATVEAVARPFSASAHPAAALVTLAAARVTQ